jgi:hypothetical protein
MTKIILAALTLVIASACNSAFSQTPAPSEAPQLPSEQTPAQTPVQQDPKPEACVQRYAGSAFLLHDCGTCTVASSAAGIALVCK